ncbi:unnamed protein product [Adineta ricciae]|uniref:Uncharacterized protein n=1 Tax=Adineta ricciae TaxID=249248 RepID=A0A814I4N2_ADIRI|nr:unnamed protein product [Adineta ricciae]CAF1550118.1 unnamed protein product [Adineta ricciae]
MHDGPFQFYFLFGILQHGAKLPVDITFRPQLEYRNFYDITETIYDLKNKNEIIKRREIESVEKVIQLKKKTIIGIINRKAKLDPYNEDEWNILLKRPYFDRLEQFELPGDLRSRTSPFGHMWMLFPAPENLMTPDIKKLYEGQKWAVKMAGSAYDMNYELTNIDHENHQAIVEGRNGICSNGEAGVKRWNASWIVDTRDGVIKEMQLRVEHENKQKNEKTRTITTKIWTRGEEDPDKRYDYEFSEGRPDL